MSNGRAASVRAGIAATLWSIIALAANLPGPCIAASAVPFGIDDYFALHRVVELALSYDGEWLAYTVQTASLADDASVRNVYVRSLRTGAESAPTALQQASALAWLPRTHQLGFLSAAAGHMQVFAFEAATAAVMQRTNAQEPVVSFRFSKDGGLAYVTQPVIDQKASLYRQLREGSQGILLDADMVGMNDFSNPHWASLIAAPPRQFWLQQRGAPPAPVSIPGDISDYYWSDSGAALSVTYVAKSNTRSVSRAQHTSAAIVSAHDLQLQVFAVHRPAQGGEAAVSFVGGPWLPTAGKFVLQRFVATHPWASWMLPDWTIVDASGPFQEGKMVWTEAESAAARITPIGPQALFVENTRRGVRSLYEWRVGQPERTTFVSRLDGASALIAFSEDRRAMAFANESLTRPQEIYLWRAAHGKIEQLTRLNTQIAQRIDYTATQIDAKSEDGVVVRGWLLAPDSAKFKAPWPLVTFVHGGPVYVYQNAFAPYFPMWPYPFEAYAANGIAVYFPNYRGTGTFGRNFMLPVQRDREPVADILAGIKQLVATGVADPQRLGISGQSYGGWLGPLVMTREKLFAAASFAEGMPNILLSYYMVKGMLNREVNDVIWGGSPYDAAERYLAMSPALHFQDVKTANLFESGAYGQAVEMLGFAQAAKRFGVPAESVVYPQTQHAVTSPRIMRESAQRNLDWFRFWLQQDEDPAPDKAGQYQRWRQLREQQEDVNGEW